MIGSSGNSQHLVGQAADFHVLGRSHEQVVRWIKSHLVFDQLILEFHDMDQPNKGWIHISYVTASKGSDAGARNRQQTLTYDGTNYRAFL
jgi:hypothetical protein